MNSKESRREFIESLRQRLNPDEFGRLLRCLDPQLGYEVGSVKYRLSQVTPDRLALWEKERAEFQEPLWEKEHQGSCYDPFITRLPPPRRLDLDVDDVTDLLKYVYATLSRAIAELQYQLAELTGTGLLHPDANENLQWNWCFPYWEFLYRNTINAVRNEDTHDDSDWTIHDNSYSTGIQIMARVNIEPDETADKDWEYNKYLCGDGPVQEYPRGAIFHITEPRFREPRE